MDADVAAVLNFVAQVRIRCRALVANPFNTGAGESLVDLLVESAPVAEAALLRISVEETSVGRLLDAAEARCH